MRRPLRVTAEPREVPWPLLRQGGPPRVCIGPDGRWLVSGADDGVRLADLETGQPTFALDTGAVRALACTASIAAVGVGDRLLVVHAFAGRVHQELALGAPVRDVACAHDGTWLAVLDAAGEVRVFRVATGRRVAAAVVDGGTCLGVPDADDAVCVGTARGALVRLGLDGRFLDEVAAGEGGVTRLVPTRAGVVRVPAPFTVGDALPDGALVVGGADGWGVLRDGTFERLGDASLADLAAHPAGRHVALATVGGEVGLMRLPG
ncbi:MAG TPA: hypothetical protein VIK91_27375 [Nannocystis sp.]